MTLSNELFVRAVNWLIDNRKVDDQQDLSLKTGITETTISRIMNDRVKKPSEETIKKLLDAFPGVFNPDYFRGKNIYMLMQDVIDAKIAANEKKEESNKWSIDQSSLVNAALAAKDETIRAKEETIASLRDTIEALKLENALLRQQLNKYQAGDIIEQHPFPVGVADAGYNNKKEQART